MILSILNQLEATSSLNVKKDILREHLDNELLKNIFQATMDPRISYYIKKIPKYTTSDQPPVSLSTVIANLGRFSGRYVTGNAATKFLKECLESLSSDDAEVLERIIKRDLRCGVKTGIVNDVFGEEFIYSHPVLLASKYEAKTVEALFKKNKHVIVQLKNDGLRCTIEVHPTEIIVKTRAGQVLDLRGHFDSLIGSSFEGFVIDGELMVGKCDRKTGNGILYKAQHGTISDAEIAQVFLASWDRIPLYNFLTKTKTAGDYEERLRLLAEGIDSDKKALGLLTLIPSEIVTTLIEARVIAEKYIAEGLEGAIFKSPVLAWEDKRSKDIVKFKAERTADLIVVGWEYGAKGRKFEKSLGGTICETRCGKLRVTVGGGYLEDERNSFLGFDKTRAPWFAANKQSNKNSPFWLKASQEQIDAGEATDLNFDMGDERVLIYDEPDFRVFDIESYTDQIPEVNEEEIDKIKGLIQEVLYNEIISSKGSDIKSLFLPRKQKIRLDKDVANSLEEMD